MPFQSFTDAVGVTKWKRGVRFSPKSLHEGDVGVVLGRAVGGGPVLVAMGNLGVLTLDAKRGVKQ